MQKCFDDTRGSLAVSHCASEATRADLEGTALRSNYYLALGAAGALLQFLEQVERNTLIACNNESIQCWSITGKHATSVCFYEFFLVARMTCGACPLLRVQEI